MAIVTLAGLQYAAKILNGVSTDLFIYLATGSGSTAEAESQTALVSENTASGMGRAEATCSYVADYTMHWEYEWTNNSAGDVTIREIAIFDAASNGHMLIRHVYSEDTVVPPTGKFKGILTAPVAQA